MNELTENQPIGISAFGWGFLGFFGANMIINVLAFVGLSLMSISPDIMGQAIISTGFFAAGLWLAIMFRNSREFRATATGVNIAVAINCLQYATGLIGALI